MDPPAEELAKLSTVHKVLDWVGAEGEFVDKATPGELSKTFSGSAHLSGISQGSMTTRPVKSLTQQPFWWDPPRKGPPSEKRSKLQCRAGSCTQ